MTKLSDCELEIMNIIWEREKTTSKEIIAELQQKNWSQNTIRTFINRLLKKEAIRIIGKKGLMNIYVPFLDKNEYYRKARMEFLRQFFNGSAQKYVESLIKEGIITIADIKKLTAGFEDISTKTKKLEN